MQKGAAILVKILFGVYISLVLFFCFYSFPSSNIDLSKYIFGIRLDRFAHFIMFFPYPIITWLTIAYSPKLKLPNYANILLTFNSGLAIAAITEILQALLFKRRQGDIIDFVADSLAILFATIIICIIGKWIVRLLNRLFSH